MSAQVSPVAAAGPLFDVAGRVAVITGASLGLGERSGRLDIMVNNAGASDGGAASETGVVGLTRELGVRWARRGVRVNAIAPGWFPTELTGRLENEDHVRWIEQRTPMRRAGGIDELDGALIFLASDASSYVVGQTLVVDGDWTVW